MGPLNVRDVTGVNCATVAAAAPISCSDLASVGGAEGSETLLGDSSGGKNNCKGAFAGDAFDVRHSMRTGCAALLEESSSGSRVIAAGCLGSRMRVTGVESVHEISGEDLFICKLGRASSGTLPEAVASSCNGNRGGWRVGISHLTFFVGADDEDGKVG